MTPRQLKRLAAREPVAANIVSDGCRDYLVEIVWEDATDLLRQRERPLRLRSLAEAHELLRACRVRRIVLRHRVAHDEACAAPAGPAQFHDLPLKMAS